MFLGVQYLSSPDYFKKILASILGALQETIVKYSSCSFLKGNLSTSVVNAPVSLDKENIYVSVCTKRFDPNQ